MSDNDKAYVVLEEALDALIDRARDAVADYRKSGSQVDGGRVAAYYDVLTVMLQDADVVALPLPARILSFDPDRELLVAGRKDGRG